MADQVTVFALFESYPKAVSAAHGLKAHGFTEATDIVRAIEPGAWLLTTAGVFSSAKITLEFLQGLERSVARVVTMRKGSYEGFHVDLDVDQR